MAGKINGQTVLPGVGLSLAIAIAALLLSNIDVFKQHAISALTLAILIGIVFGNTFYSRMTKPCTAGVLFSRQRLLQLGIILYGFRLTFSDIANVGFQGVLIDLLVLTTTFVLAWYAGHKLFKLDTNTVILIGAGSSICGAAAIMATEPVVRGRAEHVSVAVSTVLIFGTIAMIIYPMLFMFNQTWDLLPTDYQAFGLFTGSTVHEVAQVVATAKSLGDATTDTAVITKMVRVMMLAPFLMLLSFYLPKIKQARTERAGKHTLPEEHKNQAPIVIPWFAVIFILVAGLNSMAILPNKWVLSAINLDTLLLAMAMAAMGLCTHISAIRQAGIRPMLLGGLLFVWLIVGGTMINASIMYLFS